MSVAVSNYAEIHIFPEQNSGKALAFITPLEMAFVSVADFIIHFYTERK
jgi:hypothetical protein